ncbi:hypothetical protein C1N71_07790 [Agrococcus sp. SGAir0287]|nr:hypothetical protein C1N71_07790 [Agrococcus sp. SGAir0287]
MPSRDPREGGWLICYEWESERHDWFRLPDDLSPLAEALGVPYASLVKTLDRGGPHGALDVMWERFTHQDPWKGLEALRAIGIEPEAVLTWIPGGDDGHWIHD